MKSNKKMEITIKISNILVITGDGSDKVLIHCDRQSATWPYNENLIIEFRAAKDSGVDYVRDNFGIEPDVKKI